MDKTELIMLQSLPLDIKIAKSKRRIQEWIDYYGVDKVYISFSGGKDSTVLLDLVRQVNPNIPAVFVDTGLEYPETKEFVKTIENVIIVRPKMSFKQVIEKYGYPMVSKEQANYLDDIRTSTPKMRLRRLEGDNQGRFKLSKKWHYLIDAPFKVSHRCCNVMKKQPAKKYEHDTGRVPFIGTLAEESILRQQSYLKTGCNAFNSKRPNSTPLGFWREQDVLEYIYTNNLPINKAYGEVLFKENDLGNKTYYTTRCDRTGCVFCGFGAHLEKEPNRYQRLELTHPQLHSYCMDKLGFKEVCEYMNIPYDLKDLENGEWLDRDDYYYVISHNKDSLISQIKEIYNEDDDEVIEELISQLNGEYIGAFVVYGSDDYPLCDCVIRKLI